MLELLWWDNTKHVEMCGVDPQNVPDFYGPIKTSIPDGCHLRGR